MLTAFASKQRQRISSDASAQEVHINRVHPQIEELIHDLTRQMDNRPVVTKSYSFLEVRKFDKLMLESPMTSSLLCASKIIETRTKKGGVTRKACWEQTLAVHTVDGFLHLFGVLPSSTQPNSPEEVFLDLVRASKEQKDTSAKDGCNHLTPTESVFLPNCVVECNPKEKRNFDVREDRAGKFNKIATRRLVFRTRSPEETNDWIDTLYRE